MKRFRIIVIFVCAVMLCGCNISVNTKQPAATDTDPKTEVTLSEAEYPFYFNSIDNESKVNLCFVNDDKVIPYIDIDTAVKLLEDINHESNHDEGYKVSASSDGTVATLTRENEHKVTIDCDNDLIGFDDYDAFLAPSWSKTVIDTLEHYGTIPYLQINEERSYSRSGEAVDIDTGKYDIDLIGSEGKCYIPLQTFSDVFLSLSTYNNLIYNGEAVYSNMLSQEEDQKFVSKTYSAPKGNRSRKLADFTYNELCLVMDNFYGLKTKQGIDDFDSFISEIGLKDRMRSEDSKESAKAVAEFLELYIDDLHSFYLKNSYLTGSDFNWERRLGESYHRYVSSYYRFKDEREKKYPDGVPGYEEIGNTAYITFDTEESLADGADYYNDPPKADTKDTVGILLYAFDQIKRENSPIENVVFDMSLNGGGDQTTSCFMLSMILGGSSMVVKDTLSGAYVVESFKADANLDKVFDKNDSLSDYNLYCIISPISFSCGNLIASELKNSNMVTILGQTSGGGTCIINPISLADGTLIRMSSCRCMTSIHNGAMYDIDRGVDPDIYISKPSDFYDRETLTELINEGFYDD